MIEGFSRRGALSRLPAVWIQARVIEQTVQVLRESGEPAGPHEGVVYWAGRHVEHESFVTTCIAPKARTTFGSFATSSDTNAQVVMYLASAGLELLGQVHSHPGDFVDHSPGDDARALMPYPGFLSVVVPEYAGRGMRPLASCGVHVFGRRGFYRLTDAEVEAHFRIVDEFADLRL